LVEQGAHAVEGASVGRVQPAKAVEPLEARGQDTLEEAAEELARFQIDLRPTADLLLALWRQCPAMLSVNLTQAGVENPLLAVFRILEEIWRPYRESNPGYHRERVVS
jgi:hypothetical protein